MSGVERRGGNASLYPPESRGGQDTARGEESAPSAGGGSKSSSSQGHKFRRLDVNPPLFVRDVMTLNVATIASESTLAEAVDLLLRHHISGVPVVRGTTIVGVLSEKDIARLVLSKIGLTQLPYHLLALLREFTAEQAGNTLAEVRQVLASTSVDEVMTERPVVVSPDTPVDQAAQSMIRNRIHRLPVVDHGKLVGIVTREDITRVSAGLLAGEFD